MKDWQDSGAGEAIPVRGIVAGTRIATATGWRPVETLSPGESVLTVESGFQPVSEARQARLPARALPHVLWPVTVPRGALDCRDPLLLLPDQLVLIECDQAEALFGDALALVPAAALAGWRGIARVPHAAGARAVALAFAAPQVIYASRAVLLACPEAGGRAEGPAALSDVRRPRPGETPLTFEQARHLVTCLIAEDVGSALRG